MTSIVELTATQTHDLRRRVLRVGTPSTELTYAQDDADGTIFLGVSHDSRIVAVSTWTPETWPGASRHQPRPAVWLRGMAVEPALQGQGFGALLVRAGVERAWANGAEVVWASARDTALPFYLRLGFTIDGDVFTDAATGLPHHHISLSHH